MISSSQFGAVLARPSVPAFFMIEVAALGPALAVALGRGALHGQREGAASIRWLVDAGAQVGVGDAAARRRRRRSSWPDRSSAARSRAAELRAAARLPPCRCARAAAGAWRSVQPPFSGPTRFSFGTFTSVKKVSQNGEVPVISLIGRTSTPGDCMSISRKLMPSCFLVVSVRTRQKHQSAYCAPVVQIFWPLTRKWSPLSSALVCREARSEPAPGSEIALAPAQLAAGRSAGCAAASAPRCRIRAGSGRTCIDAHAADRVAGADAGHLLRPARGPRRWREPAAAIVPSARSACPSPSRPCAWSRASCPRSPAGPYWPPSSLAGSSQARAGNSPPAIRGLRCGRSRAQQRQNRPSNLLPEKCAAA